MFKKYLIKNSKTLLEAMTQINSLKSEPLVLFVVNDNDQIIGTLTDGDIRRALIKGNSVSELVVKAAHKDFHYILDSQIHNIELIRKFRESKIGLVPILDSNSRIIDVLDLYSYKSKLPIDAVLMAGGKGERLRPLTEKTPKPLLHIGEKSIIDINIDNLISYGIRNINVTVNYLADQIEEHFKENINGIHIKTIREPRFLGTIGSLRFVDSLINDTVLVMNSDLFTNINFEDFYFHFVTNKAEMSIAAVPYNVSIPYGVLNLKGKNVTGVSEKPKYDYYINAGIYLLKKSIIKEIPEDTFYNATDLIEMLVKDNRKIIRFPLNGTWIDIGTPQEYKKAQELVKHLMD